MREMLQKEIEAEFTKLKTLKPGTDEHMKVVRTLDTLYKLHIEDISRERDFMEKCDANILAEKDIRMKELQSNRDMILGWAKIGVEAAGIVLPVVLYATWLKKGFEFEETGTITSKTFSNLIGKIRPTK